MNILGTGGNMEGLLSSLNIEEVVTIEVDHSLLVLVVYDDEYFLVAHAAHLDGLTQEPSLPFAESDVLEALVLNHFEGVDLVLTHDSLESKMRMSKMSTRGNMPNESKPNIPSGVQLLNHLHPHN